MQQITHLIAEMHRRSLWQVLGIYIFGSWAVFEIIAEATDRMGLPDWVPGFAIVLFLIGLPIVLATAFVQEGLPGRNAGQNGDQPASTPAQQPSEGPSDPTLVPGFDGAPAHVASTEPRGAEPRPAPSRADVLFTWKRSVLAGIVAFLLLGVTAGGYMGLREAGVPGFASLLSSGALDERDPIIIAQLMHGGGDTITAAAVTEALRVDLSQSPVLTVMEASFVGDALERMGRPRDTRLTGAVAREVAIREGAKAVLEGEIMPAGSGSIITARLLNASTGELLVSHRETANGDDEVIAAIDRMSRKLRERIGESLRTVRSNARLEAVTTSSLRALQLYTQGAHALSVERDYDRAIRLLQEAVAEDTTFAMAWRKLAVGFYNTRAGRDSLLNAAQRAYDLRDRLTERERYHALGFYHLNVSLDHSAAISAYRSLLDVHPDDHAALNNLALTYRLVRDSDRAVEYYNRAIAADSFVPGTWTNLALAEYGRGNVDRARALLSDAASRFPDQRDHRAHAAGLAHAEGEWDAAERILTELVAESRDSDTWRARSTFTLAWLVLTRGRVTEARRMFTDAIAANRARGVADGGISVEGMTASLEAWLLQQPETALRRLRTLLASDAWTGTPPASRPHLMIAQAFAAAGEPAKARALVAEFDALPSAQRVDDGWDRSGALGMITLAEGRPADAIELFRQSSLVGGCEYCGLATVALAFREAGMPDSAIAYYRRYIDTPALDRIGNDAWDLGPAYESLAELYEATGDIAAARQYAALFVELWKDADPVLQPRVRQKRDMLERLVEG